MCHRRSFSGCSCCSIVLTRSSRARPASGPGPSNSPSSGCPYSRHASSFDGRTREPWRRGPKQSPAHLRFASEVSHFKAEPILGAPGGRSVAYHMTVLLPPRFDLDVDLRSTASDLGQIRIAGHLLKRDGKNATDALSTLESSSPDSMSWRHIHLHRDLRSVSIEIDGRLSAEDTFPEPTTEWLTIEPGSQNTAEFRELKVSW